MMPTGTIGVILFGRVTYQGMASYWPTPFAIENDPVIAAQMNGFPKIVISHTLDKAEWNNTRLIKDNVAEEITKLKQQPGKDIIIDGSASLVQSLMGTDLIDEYRFLVLPFIMGRGRRFFPEGTPPTKLRLVESKMLSFGALALIYQPDNK